MLQIFKTNSPKAGLEFSPELLQIQDRPPSPLPRMVLVGLLILIFAILLWSIFGRLDIVSIADGKLVPVSYLKIVQPADSGIVREILVHEGQQVSIGQALVKMDPNISEADSKSIQQALKLKGLELRRIEAELNATVLKRESDDDSELYQRIADEFSSNIRAHNDNLSTERVSLQKSTQDLAASMEIQHKLEKVLPNYQTQEQAYEKLGKLGFAGNLLVSEKQRERIEKEQDLLAQQFNAQSLRSTITQSENRLAQIQSAYRQKLEAEHVATYAEYKKLEQEWAKQVHKNSLLELKAPQSGIIKDVATHTPGTVVSPGAILMTIIPNNEDMQAEVWLKNEDAGFVRIGQKVKIKLSPYPFQKYGMIDGEIVHVSADATDRTNSNQNKFEETAFNQQLNQSSYRTLIKLKTQSLQVGKSFLGLSPGMAVTAEIVLSDQTVLEYVFSPIRKAFLEAARER